MLYIVPIFIIMPLILMGITLIAPSILGKRIPPSFTKEKTQIINIAKNELFELLTDYKNYPLWIKYLFQVKTERIGNGKIKIMQTYKKRKVYQELTEVRRIENEEISEISIFKSEDEGVTLWAYILENYENSKTKMTIKETMYVYHPYLRFVLKYILKDENGKGDFFKRIKRFIRKNKKIKNKTRG